MRSKAPRPVFLGADQRASGWLFGTLSPRIGKSHPKKICVFKQMCFNPNLFPDRGRQREYENEL